MTSFSNFWNRLYWVSVSHYQTVDKPLPVECVIEPNECLQMCCKKADCCKQALLGKDERVSQLHSACTLQSIDMQSAYH